MPKKMRFKITKRTVNVPRMDYLIKTLKGGRLPKKELDIFKKESSSENYYNGVKELFTDPGIRSLVIGTDFTHDVSKLFTGTLGAIGPIDRELIWSACELFTYKTKLNEFIALKEQYTVCVLHGDYQKAKKCLESIEKDFGLSFWLIENKLSLIGYTESHDLLKSYEEELVSAAKNNRILIGIIKNLVHKSTLESSNVLLGKFTNSLIRTVEELGHKHAIDYFKFKLDPYNYSGQGYASVIVWERLMPIVDRYETLVKICQRICVSGEKNILKYVAKAINSLKDKVQDQRLENIMTYMNENIVLLPGREGAYKAIEEYSIGNFKTSSLALKEIICENPNYFNLWEMLAKSKIQSADTKKINDSLYGCVIEWMIDVLMLNDKFSESAAKLKNMSRIFSSLCFTNAIQEFLYKNHSYCEDRKRTFHIQITDLNSHVLTPRFVFSTKNEMLMLRLQKVCPVSSAIMKCIYAGDSEALRRASLPMLRKNKSLVTLLMMKGLFPEACEICSWLLREDVRIYKVMALRNIIKCLYKTESFDKCIEVLVDAILKQPSLIYSLQVSIILDGIESGKIKIKDDNLKALILYDCYSKSISSNRNDKIADMFDRFIDINDYESPLDIIDQVKYDKEEVQYFLKYICITENLDVLDIYTKSDEVNSERVKICEKLRENDPMNRAEYEFMIDEIITKMIVESAMSQVDGGRIYIDVDGLKRTLRTTFSTNFSALKAEFPAIKGGENFRVDVGLVETRIVTPRSAFGRRLFSLYKELYKEFKENTEYGLDCSLGTDFRHGHLSNQIRPTLDRYKLIFQKGADGKYTSNKYWYDKYSVISLQLAKDVDHAITELSSEIDKLIDEMKSDWFNISGTNFPSVSLSDEQFLRIQEEFEATTQSEEFLNYLLHTILEISDTAFSAFKKGFASYYAWKINSIFSSILKQIEPMSESLGGLYDELLVCKNELYESGDEISSWIGLSSILDPPGFNINIPLAHSIDVFKRLYMHNNIQYVTNIACDATFKGKHLRSFVRIFIILIENAIKHSGLNTFTLDISAKLNAGTLILSSKNMLGSSISIESLKSEISDVMNNIQSEKFLDISKNDKRSGIYKIARILHSNIGCANSIMIDVGNNNFALDIVMDCEEVVA